MGAPNGNENNLIWTLEKTKDLLEFILFKIEIYELQYINEIDPLFGFKSNSIKYILSKHNLYTDLVKYMNSINKTRKSLIPRKKATKKDIKKTNELIKKKYKTNTDFRLRVCFSSLLRHHLINKNNKHVFDIVGYTLKDLKNHLEKTFKENMTWDNYGSYWHIDHIKPASLFNHNNKDEFKKCWSLNNLRALSKKDNLIKSNHYDGE